MVSTFCSSVVLGFSIAAPVGPIGVLCVRRTLSEGGTVGFICGLGAATADALYGLLASLGLTAVSTAAANLEALFRALGAAYLAFLGVRTILARPTTKTLAVDGRTKWGAFASTLVLTLANPMTILSFAAMFSAITVDRAMDPWHRTSLLVGGVFLGSAAWWLLLSSGVSRLRSRLSSAHVLWVNRGSGVVLIGFAGWALLSFGLPT